MHADERQGFYKLALPFLMEVARHAQTTQNRKLIIFLQYIKKKIIETAFVFYCDAKHSDILWGSSHARCYLFHLKSICCSPNIQIFVFFPFLSALPRFKRTNKSEIIYVVKHTLKILRHLSQDFQSNKRL